MQGTWVQSLVGELGNPTCHGATKPKSHNYWTLSLWSPHATTQIQRSQMYTYTHIFFLMYRTLCIVSIKRGNSDFKFSFFPKFSYPRPPPLMYLLFSRGKKKKTRHLQRGTPSVPITKHKTYLCPDTILLSFWYSRLAAQHPWGQSLYSSFAYHPLPPWLFFIFILFIHSFLVYLTSLLNWIIPNGLKTCTSLSD